MKKKVLFVCGIVCLISCASPGHFMANVWPQKSIQANEYGDLKAAKKVLICGVTSPFKQTIIKSIVDTLTKESVYVKTIRLKGLRKVKPTEWNAVLIFNTCMAWEMDFNVKRYVRKHPEYGSFIVVTTSGEPDSCGSTKQIPKNIDAISTASESAKLPGIIDKAIALLREKLNAH